MLGRVKHVKREEQTQDTALAKGVKIVNKHFFQDKVWGFPTCFASEEGKKKKEGK